MFAARFFPAVFYAPRYFPEVGQDTTPATGFNYYALLLPTVG